MSIPTSQDWQNLFNSIKELKETSTETRESNKETNRKLDKVAKMIGGHVNLYLSNR